MGIRGTKALVTGGSRGIGHEIAKRLVAAGVKVVVTGRNEDTLRPAAEKIGATWRLAYREEPWNDLNAVALGGGRIVLASRSARWHDPGFGGLGLLSSADGGETWEPHAGAGLDHPEVMSLAADPFIPDRFWFGTWGNSVGRFEVVP